MDLNEAIRAHVEWLVALVDLLEGRGHGALSVDNVRREDHCKIGQWIHRHEAQFGQLPEYRQLRDEHAYFHTFAADIIEESHQHGSVEAVQRLERLSGQASDRLIICVADFLDSMRRHELNAARQDEGQDLKLLLQSAF